ncbi:hypothetical protein QNH10_09525 [Sporosarcina thermotolerans]|uniref:hypothetical protein n=1 Tax=Sporosarcina thermotolerans TaxID=633404 RepID=UPI0024BC94CD|nr:hypothetical protein [Sporosarcina thermotolerans]WHT49700.1 hypothetical protein QNH10_09525 [Sporosarcina thermotolerans]
MVIFIILTAFVCSNSSGTGELDVHSTGNPDAKEILTLDPEADIFQFEGVIYKTGIDWVEELTLTKGEQVGKSKKEVIQIQTLKMKCRISYLLVQRFFQQ